jgi:plastocyanin
MFRPVWLIALVLPLLAVFAFACGDPRNDDDTDGSPEATEEATETETASPEATDEPADTPEPEPEGPQTLEISAENLEFSTDLLEAEPGEITVVFTNNEAVPHNFSLYEDEDFSEDIFVGELLSEEGASEEIELGELDAATYYFRCDVHPVDMVGELVVE